MKKAISIGIIVSTGFIAACGGSAPPPAPAPTVSVSSDKIEEMKPVEAPAETEPATMDTAAGQMAAMVEMILQNFEPNNGTEKFDIYVWDYGKARPKVVAAKGMNGSQGAQTAGDIFGLNFMTREVDLTAHQTVFVHVLDSTGDNTIEVGLRDMKDKMVKVWSTEKTTKGKWARVSVDLAAFKGKIDLAHVKNVEIFVFNAGMYCFDDFGAK